MSSGSSCTGLQRLLDDGAPDRLGDGQVALARRGGDFFARPGSGTISAETGIELAISALWSAADPDAGHAKLGPIPSNVEAGRIGFLGIYGLIRVADEMTTSVADRSTPRLDGDRCGGADEEDRGRRHLAHARQHAHGRERAMTTGTPASPKANGAGGFPS